MARRLFVWGLVLSGAVVAAGCNNPAATETKAKKVEQQREAQVERRAEREEDAADAAEDRPAGDESPKSDLGGPVDDTK